MKELRQLAKRLKLEIRPDASPEEIVQEVVEELQFLPQRHSRATLGKALHCLLDLGSGICELGGLVEWLFGADMASRSCATLKRAVDWQLLLDVKNACPDQVSVTRIACRYLKEKARWGRNSLGEGCYEYLEFLLRNGADPARVVEPAEGTTLMHCAAGLGSVELIGFFMRHGGDPRQAIEAGFDAVELRRRGLVPDWDPNAGDEEYGTALVRCLYTGKVTLERLELLHEWGADFSVEGVLSACMELYFQKLDTPSGKRIFQRLVSYGADPNALDREGNLLLQEQRHQMDRMEPRALESRLGVLVDLGLDLCAKDRAGRTFFHCMVERNPKRLDVLRKFVTRAPDNPVEAMLFSGQEETLRMLDDSRRWSGEQVDKVLEYALVLRYDRVVRRVLELDPDVGNVLRALKAYGAYLIGREPLLCEVRNSLEWSCRMRFMRYVARFGSPRFRPLWEHVIEVDDRKRAVELAVENLSKIVGEEAASRFLEQANRRKETARRKKRGETKEFCRRVEALFDLLKENGVYAENIDGKGWAPSDHGWMMLDHSKMMEWAERYGEEGEVLGTCYTDLKYLKKEARLFGASLTSVSIYYEGETARESRRVAETIVRLSPEAGLEATWSGDVMQTVELTMPKAPG